MLKNLLPLLLLFFSGHIYSDELYTFKKIDCFSEIQTFQVNHLEIFNVGFNGVWRKDWEEHKTALKALEEKNGLYIFNQQYGWHDGKDKIECLLDNGKNTNQIVITYEAKKRIIDTPIGSEKPLKWNPILTITHSKYGVVFTDSVLNLKNFIYVNSNDSGVYIKDCKGKKCKEKHVPYYMADKTEFPIKLW